MSGRSSFYVSVVAAVSLVGLWGCGSNDTVSNLEVLVKGNNQFAFDLYGKLREEGPKENTFFSPVSISVAMAMVQAGARGGTAAEIAQTMHFSLPQSELHPACCSLLKISQTQDICELHVTNQLWAHQDGCSYNMMFMRIGECIHIEKGVSRKRSNGRVLISRHGSIRLRPRLLVSSGNPTCRTVA